MKNLLCLCAVVLLFSNTSYSQNPVSDCQYAYTVSVADKKDAPSNSDIFADVTWDFSGVTAASQQIKIEVLPIRDCFNEIAGVSFRELQTIVIDDSNKSGVQSLSHLQMNTKCFKWRVLISATDCNVVSEWEYYSFVGKK